MRQKEKCQGPSWSTEDAVVGLSGTTGPGCCVCQYPAGQGWWQLPAWEAFLAMTTVVEVATAAPSQGNCSVRFWKLFLGAVS